MKQNYSTKQIEREIQSAERQERLDNLVNQHSKREFISDIKNGLGKVMKENPSMVEIVEKPKLTFKEKLINFFNRF